MAFTQNPELPIAHAGATGSVHEDLQHEVAIMSPTTAPMLAFLPRGPRPISHEFDWTADYIAAPETAVGVTSGEFGTTPNFSAFVQGWEAGFPDEQLKQRMRNYTCIVNRTIDISGTQRAVSLTGTEDSFEYRVFQMYERAVEQFSYNLLYGVGSAPTDGSAEADAGMTHGIIPWIVYTGNVVTGTVTINTIAVTRSAATARTGYSGTYADYSGGAATRALFNSAALQPAWTRGMTIPGSIGFCSPAAKRAINNFAFITSTAGTSTNTVNQRNIDGWSKALVDVVDVFETDFGTVGLVLNRHMIGASDYAYTPTASGTEDTTIDTDDLFLMVERRFWEVCMLRPLTFSPLAKVGDTDKGLINLEGGLKAKNPIAGIIGNNFTAA